MKSSESNLFPRIDFLIQSVVRSNISCPYCENKKTSVVAKKYLFIKIRRCSVCNLYFTDPIYKPSLKMDLYDGLYKSSMTTDMPNKSELEEIELGQHNFKNRNFSHIIKKLLSISNGRDLLEIGSSWGYFLHQANTLGFKSRGVEISKNRREFGNRHLKVQIYSSFEEIADRCFDVVFTFHTLEHFTSLKGVFKKIYSLLKPGGLLVIVVPNFDPDLHGNRSLKIIGAVHPLGINSAFLKHSLSQNNFINIKLFNDWDSVPLKPIDHCTSDGILCVANK